MGKTAIAGVVLIPLIIGVIEAVKRFFPRAHGNVWFGVSLILGIVGQAVIWITAAGGLPATLEGWAALVMIGLSFGLASGKAYDESLGKGPA